MTGAATAIAGNGDATLDRLFLDARSTHAFAAAPVPDAVLERLVALAMLGPTAFNQQPLRILFLRGAAAKARLAPALSSGNRDKTMAAPVTAVLCWDMGFADRLPELWPKADVRGHFADEHRRRDSARRNGTLQAGYLLMAARALGLGCGPMSGFDAGRVAAEFLAGSGWEVNLLVNLGWPAPDAPPPPPRLPRLGFGDVARIL
jgi:3-hydroxypropanoate dehydrogenase